jgi:hypothetical protein
MSKTQKLCIKPGEAPHYKPGTKKEVKKKDKKRMFYVGPTINTPIKLVRNSCYDGNLPIDLEKHPELSVLFVPSINFPMIRRRINRGDGNMARRVQTASLALVKIVKEM